VAAELLRVRACRSSGLLDDRTPVPSVTRIGEYPAYRWPWFDQVPTDDRDEDGLELTTAWREISREARGQGDLDGHARLRRCLVRQRASGAPAAAWMRLGVANTGLTIISWNDRGEARLDAFNETSHLEGVST
jgi:hypothetical protein